MGKVKRIIGAVFVGLLIWSVGAESVKWDLVNKKLAGSGWKLLAGKARKSQDGLILVKKAMIRHQLSLKAGLYELTADAKGRGKIVLSVSGKSLKEASRTLRLNNENGLFGLLFAVGKDSPATLEIKIDGHQGVVKQVALIPADEQQKKAWKAAEDSFVLLGYYGSDPQRPAPGSSKRVAQSFSAETLKNQAIKETVMFYDPNYDAHWVKGEEGVAGFFSSRGFKAMTAPQITTWMKEKIQNKNAVGTSAIFVMGNAPASVVHKPFADCLLAQYLKAGGRVVWLSNFPMYVAQKDSGPCFTYGTNAAAKMLGVTWDRKTFYGAPGPSIMTKAGKAWGLEGGMSLTRPLHTRGITIPFVIDKPGDHCGAGLINLNPDVPFSGFIFVPDAADPQKEWLLRNVYRLARYSGETVTIPPPAVDKGDVFPVKALLKFDPDNLRTCFQRTESMPIFLQLDNLGKKCQVKVDLKIFDGSKVIKQWQGEVVADAKKKADKLISFIDLNGLKRGKYPVVAELKIGNESKKIEQEIRVCPPPDHRGTHLAIWCSSSPKKKRTEDLLKWLKKNNIEPMFSCANSTGRDLSLWYGFSFTVRRHGHPEVINNPPGYDNYRRGSSGKILRVRAWGDKRESKSYASPFRRQAEADDFGKQIGFDNKFPAFRKYAVTADDYSQWHGLDYNRFDVEGFKARYGFEPPKPPGSEDPYGGIDVKRKKGIIADDDPWVLLSRYWSESVYGDAGRRLADAMRKNTDGIGKVGPVPGGMQIPVMQMWSAQYPPFNFGPKGFSLINFYYYNSFWQPPLAHVWWLECSRMGNRGMEQWIMPDCYHFHLKSFYINNLWLMLAGGATGFEYFMYSSETKPEAIEAMGIFGKYSRKYGLLLNELKPAPKKVGMLIPFENLCFKITNAIEMAYPFMELLQAKVDVEPVCPEELDAEAMSKYEAIILANVMWLKKGTANLLENYQKAGGKVILDKITAQDIDIPGAIKLDYKIGGRGIRDYGHEKDIIRTRSSLEKYLKPVVTCDNPYVVLRRFEADGTKFLYVTDNYTGKEYIELREKKGTKTVGELAARMGYGKDIVKTVIKRADDGTFPYDVTNSKALPVDRKKGEMLISVEIPKWEGMLIDFLPQVPKEIEVACPQQVKPGVPVKFNVYIRDDKAKLVNSPLQLNIKVTDPKGEASKEYRCRLLAKNGVAGHQFEFAVNDYPGNWEFKVSEPITGVKKEFEVKLIK